MQKLQIPNADRNCFPVVCLNLIYEYWLYIYVDEFDMANDVNTPAYVVEDLFRVEEEVLDVVKTVPTVAW